MNSSYENKTIFGYEFSLVFRKCKNCNSIYKKDKSTWLKIKKKL